MEQSTKHLWGRRRRDGWARRRWLLAALEGGDRSWWVRSQNPRSGMVEAKWLRIGGGLCDDIILLVGSAALMVGFQLSSVAVSDLVGVKLWIWNFFFLVYGFCDPRRARMVVNGLGGVAGFSVGLGMKNSCGAAGYIWIAGVGLQISWGRDLGCFGLQISWGKYLSNGMSGGWFVCWWWMWLWDANRDFGYWKGRSGWALIPSWCRTT